jgi:hypothetical protein
LYLCLLFILIYMTSKFLVKYGYYHELNLLLFYMLSFTLTILRLIYLSALVTNLVKPGSKVSSKLISLFDVLSDFGALSIGLVQMHKFAVIAAEMTYMFGKGHRQQGVQKIK